MSIEVLAAPLRLAWVLAFAIAIGAIHTRISVPHERLSWAEPDVYETLEYAAPHPCPYAPGQALWMVPAEKYDGRRNATFQ